MIWVVFFAIVISAGLLGLGGIAGAASWIVQVQSHRSSPGGIPKKWRSQITLSRPYHPNMQLRVRTN